MLEAKFNSGHGSMSSRKTQRWWSHKRRAPKTGLTSHVFQDDPPVCWEVLFRTVWSALLWNCCFLISRAWDAAAAAVCVCVPDRCWRLGFCVSSPILCACVCFTLTRTLPCGLALVNTHYMDSKHLKNKEIKIIFLKSHRDVFCAASTAG